MNRRNLTLDGMRGAAAFVVVIFHLPNFFPEVYRPAAGYLAVDVFFGLSGFVLVDAYAQRFNLGLRARDFLLLRFLRLYPSYILGTVIGLCLLVPGLKAVQLASIPLAVLMLPVPLSRVLYPFDIVAWSLFFELVANGCLALFWRYITPRSATAVAVASAVVLLIAVSETGTLDGGHKWDAFFVGLARVFFSFFVGVSLRLNNWRVFSIRPGWVVLLTTALLFMPNFGIPRWTMDLCLVVFVIPCILALAVSASEPSQAFGRILSIAGDVSYPLYAIHAPALLAIAILLQKLQLPRGELAATLSAGFLLLFCWGVERYYDKPIRARLIKLNGSIVESRFFKKAIDRPDHK